MMVQNKPSVVLKTAFEDLRNIESLIQGFKSLFKVYETTDFSDRTQVDKIFTETKTTVRSLKDGASKINKYLDENYKTWKNQFTDESKSNHSITNTGNISVDNDSECAEANKLDVSENEITTGKGIENKDYSEEARLGGENVKDKPAEESTDDCVRKDTNSDQATEGNEQSELNEDHTTQNTKTAEITDNLEKNEQTIKNAETVTRDLETVQRNDSCNLRKNKKQITENVKTAQQDANGDFPNQVQSTVENTSVVENIENVEEKKAFIKCVDINKLINPALANTKSSNPVRTNGFTDSVLVISDSDQEDYGSKTKENSKIETNKNTKLQNKTVKNSRRRQSLMKGNGDSVLICESDSDSKSIRSNQRKKASENARRSVRYPQIEPESVRKNVKRSMQKKKAVTECYSLSDTSSTEDVETDVNKSNSKKSGKNISIVKTKTIKYTKKEKGILDAQSDRKYTYEAYVSLARVPCEKLKEFYLHKKELKELKRLTNLDNLKKRPRGNHSQAKTDPESSSDVENIRPKRKRTKKGAKDSDKSHDSSSNSERELSSTVKEFEIPAIEPSSNEQPINEDQAVKMILDNIKSASDVSSKESNSEEETTNKSKEEDGQTKSSKKNEIKGQNKEKQCVDDNASDAERKKENSGWRKDKLLTDKLSDSDSEDEFVKFKKRNEKAKDDVRARICKKKKVVISSDSDTENKKKKNESEDEFQPSGKKASSSSRDSSSESEKETEKKDDKKDEPKKRRRIKKLQESSSDDEADKSTRKTIRRVIGHESLAETTKQAEKDEKERKARIADRQKKYNQMFDEDKPEDATVEKLVLDFDDKTKKEILSTNKDLVKKLKPHQAKGVQFMWDACYESVERTKKTDGSGCILAHCMGLGKTLQVIALTHTLLTNEEITDVRKVLVVCPLNTVLNWVAEYKKWLEDVDGPDLDVYELVSSKQPYERKYQVEQWSADGGVLVIGYDMFRNLTNPNNKRLRKSMRDAFYKGLVNPGPDLVVCDEGHLLKNEKTNLSIAMNRIRTLRRIVLTGTPMQNNLKEYYCMVQFVKPNLLGTYKEYLNRFVNPITNGQYTDSTLHDIHIMRRRSHVLHKLLDGLVQRKDYSVLTPFLPPKHEYILFLTLSDVQIKLYQHYKENYAQRPIETSNKKRSTSFLFVDFQEFQRICTHPRLLSTKKGNKKSILDDEEETDESSGSLKDFIDDESESTPSSSGSSSSNNDSDDDSNKEEKKKPTGTSKKRMTRNSAAAAGEVIDVIEEPVADERGWWKQYCDGEELDNIAISSKLYLLFEILQQCELIGDKLLVFSQSLYSLDIIEYFLAKIDEATRNNETDKVCGFSGSWSLGLDYFRLDGSSSCDDRAAWCKMFNKSDNTQARLFLISTRAGGLGINLVGANRVIIFDVSWNPSHDIQSIYRVYRFGQTKPCYIYRFVTQGTMEMKIYERQVTKQAISKRVIDEQQIDRHYNQTDLAELYNFDPKPADQPTPLVPKDVLFAELLQKEKDRIYKFHEHQSLLENKEDEELNEDERKAAWEEFENEKTIRVTNNIGWIRNLPVPSISAALLSIVQKDNPTWTQDQVKMVVPAIVQQLRDQVDAGQMLLFNRVVDEIRKMQQTQQQRMQEYYLQQQMQMLQQRLQAQSQVNASLGARNNFGTALQSALAGQTAHINSNRLPTVPFPRITVNTDPTEIVELND